MEIEIVCKECIKPSSPTPSNLKTYKLSLLDQFPSSTYVPLILFYPGNKSTGHPLTDIVSQRSQLLKISLSETLTRFYPFAGKIKDNLSVDCNDEGIFYSEARVNCHLVDCLNQPNLPSLFSFLPSQDANWSGPTAGDHVAMIQVNNFACGGIAIGVIVSHTIADGISLSNFFKGWAATARKACEVVCPNFDASSIFIQNHAYPREATFNALSKPFLQSSRLITKRIVFDASGIASLKAKATNSSTQNPTKVEVVSALLWKCTTAALKAKSGINKPTFITHSVNLRQRAVPTFTESSMGNLVWTPCALCTADEMELPCMVSKLREAITKINADFVRSLQGGGGFHKLCDHMKAMVGALANAASSSGMNFISFTSWCNFGLYGIDFGWGKPIWASSIGLSSDSEHMFSNTVILMDTRSGDGIEAWVWFDREVMGILELDKELLAFASFDPSPIN